jgi:DNA polymerase-3 subunit gamma/tau
VAIAEGRHIDVLEMDAATRTGIDDIRELVDSVRYAPTSARYKVYIIDEIHMLSEKAFNALLKTLEEPPPHVRFIFATTEARKVPVTVLSRCQRFDLRRVDADALAEHFKGVAAREAVEACDEAIRLIARAADGSVRDGLSLLDQAIAHADGRIEAETVRAMLGLADRTQLIDLLETLLKGDLPAALGELRRQYDAGVDPLIVVQDLLELVHWLTRVKITPEVARDVAVPEAERVRGARIAEALSMSVLARAWQMLLKGLAEARMAPSVLGAVEMVLVRLAYVADLPPPGALAGDAPARPAVPSASRPRAEQRGASSAPALAHQAVPAPQPVASPNPTSLADLVALAETERSATLAAQIRRYVHIVRFETGQIEFQPAEDAPSDLAQKIDEALRRWTGRRWIVAITSAAGAPTIVEAAEKAEARRRVLAAGDPLVDAVLQAFPGATIAEVRSRAITSEQGDEIP